MPLMTALIVLGITIMYMLYIAKTDFDAVWIFTATVLLTVFAVIFSGFCF